MDIPTIVIEEITPEKAREYLGHNLNNRNIRRTVVESYALDMASGNWKFVGDPLRFARGGQLLDGQHRLWAIVESGATVHMAVLRDLYQSSQLVLDVGIKRSFGDHLKFLGEINTNSYGAIIRAVTVWNGEGSLRYRNHLSFAALEETYEKYPELRDGFSTIRAANDSVRCGFIAGGLVWWLLNQRDSEECAKFFDLLATGDGLEIGHPIYALRRVLLADVRKGRSRSLPPQNIAALMIKGWNKWKLGETVDVLMWRGGGSSPEAFPEVL